MTGKIELQNLTKAYGKKIALQGIAATLEPGKIYGLLGRNGAGKTTLLHLINAHLFPTSGKVLIDGEEPFENSQVLRKLCFIRESGNFKKNLKVRDIIGLAALTYPGWDPHFAGELVHQFELDENKKVKALSKGMESALGVIVGLASRAPVTIFDEPYIGMDVVHRQQFYDLLLEDYTRHPRTIILSTHLIDEVSKVFEGILILDQGEVLLHEETEALRERAFYFSGERETVDELTQGLQIICSEAFGSTKQVAVFGDVPDEITRKARHAAVKIDSVPIQKLMIYLTTRQERGEQEHA
ncbi:ABC-2 type transport system ATP-binding protein [Caldalkalibacillus uzonensis]|uniref:ABC-2 type transport system ATP-binding protein n=1 Tax=Caldalkalibacillus uzonensis TaxID=353224 RepID=A0ABU0CXQ3_9BACI|nr:ABC transporter ATP-binding protein [Caldalkalibacillus uzonensis]MDQ0340697.1 ABC-2 type transport system ATP-binding protein [Caldalkalibacillus uzonensis]